MAADAWPSKEPIKIVVGFSPGGTADVAARTVSAKMSEILGQNIIVENRPGAATTIASTYVSRAAPDGYTLYVNSVSMHGLDKVLYPSITYDGNKDFTPITRWVSSPAIVVANNESGITSLADLVKQAKANPGKINAATAGKGSTIQLALIDFMQTTNTQLTEVPFRGGSPASVSVVAGETQVSFATPPTALPLAQAGKLRAISVTTKERSPLFPDIPSSVESGVQNYDYEFWYGLYSPANLPQEITDKLYAASVKALNDPQVKQRLATAGLQANPSSSIEDFKKLIATDGARMAAFGKIIGSLE